MFAMIPVLVCDKPCLSDNGFWKPCCKKARPVEASRPWASLCCFVAPALPLQTQTGSQAPGTLCLLLEQAVSLSLLSAGVSYLGHGRVILNFWALQMVLAVCSVGSKVVAQSLPVRGPRV